MALDPRSPSDIYDSVKTELTGSIDSLTNFVESGFNNAWLTAYSQQLHDIEVRLLAAQLSGWVDYAGKDTFNQDELDRLGVNGVDPAELNEHMDDQQLDEVAKLVGVERDPGQKATGQVTFDVSTDTVEIPEGYEVGTEPDDSGNYLSYLVDADGDGEITEDSDATVSPDGGASTVTVDVIAEDIGKGFNVGSDSITFIPNPKPGLEGVTNGTEVTGGTNEQTNPEFRQDVKEAVFANSGGGTAKGLSGHIKENATADIDVSLDEVTGQSPPYVDVIVDGGSNTEIENLIAESRPVGIEHYLVRPEVRQLGVRAEVVGTDIDNSYVTEQITDHLVDLTLNDEFRRSKMIRDIHNADLNIEDIGSLTVTVESVDGESDVYETGTSVYALDFAPLGVVDAERRLYDSATSIYSFAFDDVTASSVVVEASVDGDQTELARGTDYAVVDTDGDGANDAIDFSVGGVNPDEYTTFELEYTHNSDSIASTITDADGNTYDRGTDWDLVDNDADGLNDSIDWSIGGTTPADGTRYSVDYSPGRDIPRDLVVSKREKVGASASISTLTFEPFY